MQKTSVEMKKVSEICSNFLQLLKDYRADFRFHVKVVKALYIHSFKIKPNGSVLRHFQNISFTSIK